MDRLLDCPVADPEQARKGRLLNGLLLTFIAVIDLYWGISLVTANGGIDTGIGVAATGLLLILYILTRQGRVQLAAWGTIIVCLLLITGGALSTSALSLAVAVSPALLALPVALSGAILSWRAVVWVTLAASVDAGWLYGVGLPHGLYGRQVLASDSFGLAGEVIILCVTIGALALFYSRQIEQVVTNLHQQNAELVATNQTLAEQRQREHALGSSIGDLAEQLAAVSTRQITDVSTQASSISQVVSAVAELHRTADQIAATALEIRGVADAALANVQQSQEMVFRSRMAVQRNRTQVEQVIQRMRELDQLTGRITHFTASIRDLSDETHLLALNASIEAAGAGTLGRRFGVVAAEVQSLATRAGAIVDQIQEQINTVQTAGQAMLAATQDSISVAQEVEMLSDEVRGVQDRVAEGVQRTTDLVHSISTATLQQTAATKQMAHSMQQIAQIASLTSEDAEALERVTHELLGAATLLNNALATLRPQPGPAPS